jgi:hypothetical protein
MPGALRGERASRDAPLDLTEDTGQFFHPMGPFHPKPVDPTMRPPEADHQT